MLNIVRGLLLLSVVAVAGCRVAPIYAANNVVFAEPAAATQPLTMENYRAAIIRAGAARGWTFEDAGPGHLVGNIAVRGRHFATVDVTFDSQSFSIAHKSSRNLNFDASKRHIHPNFNNWVKNLQNEIQLEIVRTQVG